MSTSQAAPDASSCSQALGASAPAEELNQLAEILGRVTDDLARHPDWSDAAFLARYPAHAESLRELLPTFRQIAALPGDLSPEPRAETGPELRELGDFRIVREIGRGGMGIVYEALQISLQRRVALKVLPYAAVVDPRQMLRFRHEVQAAALLQHQHIVPVYAVGCDRGVHYYAMQFIEGQSLAQALEAVRARAAVAASAAGATGRSASRGLGSTGRLRRAERSTLPEGCRAGTTRRSSELLDPVRSYAYCRRAAEIALQAAEALDHAHRRGVIHRDVKPSNLLLDEAGDVWIADFGLAHIETEAGLTFTGDVVGTLRYMSPEQALAERAIVDHRTDVYSLGATLYELICLRPAFPEQDRRRLLRAIVSEPPLPLRAHNPATPRDLETIVAKAMEKDPLDRYATAQALADDLRRWLDDRPIAARRPALAQRGLRWCRRHAGWVAVGLAAALAGMALLSVSAGRLAREQQQTQRALASAQDSLRFARQAVDAMYFEVATQWLSADLDLTPTQAKFLEQAFRIYQRLAAEAATDPASQREAGAAYLRAAQILRRLERTTQAAQPAMQAVATLGKLPPAIRTEPECRLELASAHAELGRIEFADEQIDEAQRQWAAAERIARDLSEAFPLVAEYRAVRAETLRHQAELARRQGDSAAAVRALREAHALGHQLLEEDPKSLPYELELLRSGVALTDALRRAGDLDGAAALATSAVRRCQWLLHMNADSRPLRRVQIAALAAAGELQGAQGDWPAALASYDAALAALCATLGIGVAPEQYFQEAVEPGSAWTNQIEPEAFCQYAEIQIRQADALAMSDRPYAARQALGDAYRTAGVLADMFPRPRYQVAEVNALVELAELLERHGLPGSAVAARLAGQKWYALLRQHPTAATYCSGWRTGPDFERFRARFPEAVYVAPAGDDGPRGEHALPDRAVPALAISYAVHLYRQGAWEDAVQALTAITKSDEQAQGDAAQADDDEPEGDAYAWLVLAMAHRRVGHAEAAEQWLERARERIERESPGDQELAQLLDEAEALWASADAVELERGDGGAAALPHGPAAGRSGPRQHATDSSSARDEP